MSHLRSAASSLLLVLIVLALALWSSERKTSTQVTATSYGVMDLGTLGGATSAALALDIVDDLYLLVGYAQTASGATHAFAGAPANLRDLGTLGGTNAEAWAVSAGNGISIVGRAQTSSGAYHAFSYRASYYPGTGQLIDLGTLGGSQSYATAVNTSGTIVGASLLSGDRVTRAFIYENGTMSPLGATLGGTNTVANAVNGSEVVGYADLNGSAVHHAFLYANGTTTDVGSLGTNSEAYSINTAGAIVGRSQLSNGNQHAFLYESGVMQDLGTLGGSSSEAHGINDARVVVGWAQTSSGTRHAFIWRDGVMTDLNSLIPAGTGWVLEAATAIHTLGPIVGYGVRGGQRRAFVLWPPLDLGVHSLQYHGDTGTDTNIPSPHETGQQILMGVSVGYAYPAPTGLTIVNQLSGAVEYVPASAFVPGSSSGFSAPLACQQSGQVLTCRNVPYGFESPLYFWMRSTGPGPITHTATVRADQPDPFPADNTASIGNTAVSLAALSLKATSAIGGKSVLARATLTSPCPWGGARVTLASSNPAVAAVPTPFDVQRGCCDNGLWREFYVRTTAVSVPTTVQISATYGLVTKVVPLTVMPPQQSYGGTPWNLPGIVQAENFDGGGEGVAYHDTSAGNSGGAYRATGVDLQTTRDTGGGVNVGWISAGEWLEYTVKLASGGSYLFAARVASPGAGGTFHVEMDDVNKTGTLSIPDTGGWQTWTTISRAVTLDAGTHVLRIAFDSVGSTGAVGNLNYVQFTSSAGTPTPYGGVPRSVPGTVQAEDFDEGGEGVAYHDTTSGNAGGQYRATRVDIQRTTDLGGGYNVGWMAPGEWLNYTVSVATAGTYTLKARVGADGPGGTFHVTLGGRDVTGPLTIPDTGGWQRWTDVAATVTLQAGVQWIRFVADGAGATGVFGNLGFITVEPATDVPR